MIISAIIDIFLSVLTFILSLVSLPATPLALVQAINAVVGWISVPMGVVRNYVGDTFLVGIVAAITAYVFMTPIIHISIWLYQRIKS